MASEAIKVPFVEAAAPSTPAASRVVVYAKADGLMYSKDDAGVETLMSSGATGAMATDALWDAAGDLAQGTGANTGAKLSAGTAGMFLKSAGAAVANLWGFPPGYEWDYVQRTTNASITATTEGTANTVLTANAVTFDGAPVLATFYCYSATKPTTTMYIILTEGATPIAYLGIVSVTGAGPNTGAFRFTPTAAAHTYGVRCYVDAGTGSIGAAAGGADYAPAFLRITKV